MLNSTDLRLSIELCRLYHYWTNLECEQRLSSFLMLVFMDTSESYSPWHFKSTSAMEANFFVEGDKIILIYTT